MPLLSAYITPHPPLAVPSVGRGGEDGIPATMAAYEAISRHIAGIRPETVVVISPHAPLYADYFHISPGSSAGGDFGAFGVPETAMTVSYDQELVKTIESLAAEEGLAAGTLGSNKANAALDHGVMVPLWFVNKHNRDYKTVRVALSGLSAEEHFKLGVLIRAAIDKLGRGTVVIASGDLSHILKEPGPKGAVGRAFDEAVVVIMKSGELEKFLAFGEEERQAAAECGAGSFMILTGVLNKTRIKPEFLSYEGVYGVGYGQCIFHILDESNGPDYLALYRERELDKIEKTRENEGFLPRLARETVESFVKTGRLPEQAPTPPEFLNKKAGVFVSIKKRGALRGCIGTMSPTTPDIPREVRQNAVSACSRDFRFDPVTEEELPHLTYSVDVLSAPEAVDRQDVPAALDPAIYGVIVTSGNKRGVLLPDLEGVDTVEEQLAIALKKAGITGEHYDLERFTVTRYK